MGKRLGNLRDALWSSEYRVYNAAESIPNQDPHEKNKSTTGATPV